VLFLSDFIIFNSDSGLNHSSLKSIFDFLTIGSRLYVRQTGYNFEGFAKQAYKIYTDIDPDELYKPTLHPDYRVQINSLDLINNLLEEELPQTSQSWINECNEINRAPKVLDRHRNSKEYVSNYHFIEQLSKVLPLDHDVITSNGSANVITMQVLELKGKQRLITNTGCAPMGYGLPAAIGAAVNHNIVCIEGDGSLHFNIHELQTMKHYDLPIKLIILNNDGYLSIKVSQKTFFEGRYVASEKNSGVTLPNYEKLIKAYDLPYFQIKSHHEIPNILEEFMKFKGPCVLEVFTDPEEYHEPKVVAKLDENGKFIKNRATRNRINNQTQFDWLEICLGRKSYKQIRTM